MQSTVIMCSVSSLHVIGMAGFGLGVILAQLGFEGGFGLPLGLVCVQFV